EALSPRGRSSGRAQYPALPPDTSNTAPVLNEQASARPSISGSRRSVSSAVGSGRGLQGDARATPGRAQPVRAAPGRRALAQLRTPLTLESVNAVRASGGSPRASEVFGAGPESSEDVATVAHVEVSPSVANEPGACRPAAALEHFLVAEIRLGILLVWVADE